MSYQQSSDYKEMELIIKSQSQSKSKSVKQSKKQSFLNQVWCYIREWFTFSNEPRIREIKDNAGNHWQIYDPVTEQKFQLESQQEVSEWLEERYYKRPQNSVWDASLWR